MDVALLSLCVIGLTTAAAIVTDVRGFRIPNALTFSVLFAGLLFGFAVHGVAGLRFSLIGATLGFVMLMGPYLLGAMGAGDLKLVAALGAWLGPQMTLLMIGIGMGATAVYSLFLLAWQGRLADAWTHTKIACLQIAAFRRQLMPVTGPRYETVQDVVASPDRRGRAVPFSVMAAVGVVCVVGYGRTLLAWLTN